MININWAGVAIQSWDDDVSNGSSLVEDKVIDPNIAR